MKKTREDYARYRLENAKEKLNSAEVLLREKLFKDSLSRSYYAMFSAARALLATKELDSSKHSGVISLFNQQFLKTNIMDRKIGKKLSEAKDFREAGDYEDFFVVSKVDAERQIKNAKEFIKEAEEILLKIIKS
ncbi:MAG: hypothetical protein A3C43_04255 [Candidatus Schekmanbacteria bacterium RIFCSPHIGHO2_02_FULL_38_11]|nr:MAG: hypothetical protein A3C43_04255 [Candidatus Schekmanbacteria bacterium RIFCSPHIGHO2_02_FULL_38_11]